MHGLWAVLHDIVLYTCMYLCGGGMLLCRAKDGYAGVRDGSVDRIPGNGRRKTVS